MTNFIRILQARFYLAAGGGAGGGQLPPLKPELHAPKRYGYSSRMFAGGFAGSEWFIL